MFLIFSHLKKKIIEGLELTDSTDKSLLKGILLISIVINLSLDVFITSYKSQLSYL